LRRIDRPDGSSAAADYLLDTREPSSGTTYALATIAQDNDGTSVTTYYDRIGHAVRSVFPVGDTPTGAGSLAYVDRTYDAMGRPTTETRPHLAGAGTVYTTRHRYDNFGHQVALVLACDATLPDSSCPQNQTQYSVDSATSHALVTVLDANSQ